MAFISLLFVYFVFVCIILGFLLVTGLFFLIFGIICKRKPKNKGKKFPVVFIVIGSVLLLLPVGTTVLMIIGSVLSVASLTVQRLDYDNVTDKWRNEWVSDNTAADDAIRELLNAADAGDRETLAATFAPNIQKEAGFDSALDDFFDTYPDGLSQCELDGGSVSSSGSYNYGESVLTVNTSYTCTLNGEWYYIGLGFCHKNTDSPDDVGVSFFCVENLEAYALDYEYRDDEHLACSIVSDNDVSAKLIGGRGFLFEPTPDRLLTEAQMRAYLDKYDDLYHLSAEIGAPNVTKKYSNSTGYDHYYELAPQNGEPRYAHLCTNSPMGSFISSYICSDTECFYGETLLPAE